MYGASIGATDLRIYRMGDADNRVRYTQRLEPMSSTFLLKLGWWLFIMSAVLFGWSALRARDWLAAAGAASFLAANISFMIPVYRREHAHHDR